jgi:hypothetical protein
MAWAGVKPAGAAGQWGSERAGGSVSAKRNGHDRDVRRGLCEQVHGSVLVMMVMKPEVLMVTMMMAIVPMVIAAHPAVGVEHS